MASTRYYLCCGAYFAITVTICLLFVWLGIRGPEKHWERNAIDAQCLPVNYSTTTRMCGGDDTVWTCYNGVMNVSVNVNDTLYFDAVEINLGKKTVEETIEKMQERYPPEQYFECWYDRFDPTDIHIGIVSDSVYVWYTVTVVAVAAVATVFMTLQFRK